MIRIAGIFLCALAVLIPQQARCEKDAVVIIIDQSVYGEVKKEFDTYVKDVTSRFPVELIVLKDKAWESAKPDEIRAELQKLYKEKSVVSNGADPKDVEIKPDSPIVVGKFLDVARPTFFDLRRQIFEKARQNKKL